MQSKIPLRALCGLLMTSVAACGGGSGNSNSSPAVASGNVSMLLSDASSEDFSTIGVKVLSIALIPQAGGSNVTVYTAPATPPVVNLAELDQLGEIIGNVNVPAGTYTGAVLTISGNPGDVTLITAADPEAGFDGTASTAIPANQIQIQGTQGSAGNLTAPITVKFDSNLVVAKDQNNQLDIEFDLAHPAFIVAHTPLGGGTEFAVNFKGGPVRHHPIEDITRLVLRHLYGTVATIAADNTSITINRDYPSIPLMNPETEVTTSQAINILADATNGTLFYDLDAKTVNTITSFATEQNTLSGKFLRVAARYQQNGTLVATRIWASSTFNNVFINPEGHVLHVNQMANTIDVTNESGGKVTIAVDGGTNFYFHGGSTPIGTGTGFLGNIERGFKVNVAVVDPLANPLVAQSIDVETAPFDGVITGANMTQFTYTRHFNSSSDDYVQALNYISSSTPNGKDSSGMPILGFKWWDFAFPTQVTSGPNAINDFVAATSGAIDFGGTVGSIPARGVTYATWNDPASPNAWSAPNAILTPTRIPLAKVAVPYANNTFGITVNGGMMPVTVDVSTVAGSATQVYQADRSNGVLTISPEDITTSAGLAALTAGLAVDARVKIYGVPEANGNLKAYALTYFTGTAPEK